MTHCNAYRCQKMDGEVLEHVSHLRAFAVSLCGDVYVASDLVQETLLKALTNINSFKPGTNMRAWLFTILRNTYFTQRRRKSFEIRDEDGAIAASQSIDAAQEAHLELRDFERALGTLNDEQREAIVLVGAAGFTYEEAARIGGCSSGTVKSRVCRARARLQEMLYSGPVAGNSLGYGNVQQADELAPASTAGERFLSDRTVLSAPWNSKAALLVV